MASIDSLTDSATTPLRATPCDLCGSANFQLVSRLDRRGKPLETVVCTRCGLVSHRKLPTDAELDEFYSRHYRREYHGEAAPSAYRVARAWRTGQQLYRKLKDQVRPGDRVFEVGAGIGCTVKAFELEGYDASGIEPGEDFQEFSQKKLHSQVRRGQLEDLPPTPTYDFVLLVHVIEHFNHPSRALKQIHQILRPGGRLYIECPNVGAPHAAPGKLFHFAHVHNFTHATLQMMAQACGFRLVKQFSHPRDVALEMVFVKADQGVLEIDPESYHQTREALSRYNNLTYHLRPSYLAGRIGRLWTQYAGYISAPWRLGGILKTCRRHAEEERAQRPSPGALRKSA